MKKETIAVFDFDGTITHKDTLLVFIKFSKGICSLIFGIMLFSPLIVAMKLRLYPNWKVKQKLFSFFFKGESLEKFNDFGNKFNSEIYKILRPKALETLKLHKKKGDRIIIVSASIENWIIPWAEKVGTDIVIGTKIETNKDGLLTGNFLSKNCYGQEKVNRLLEMFPNRNDYELIVYGDSRGDKELIELSDKGFIINLKKMQYIKTTYKLLK
jgi:phosphatidylglycerophosphatase C